MSDSREGLIQAFRLPSHGGFLLLLLSIGFSFPPQARAQAPVVPLYIEAVPTETRPRGIDTVELLSSALVGVANSGSDSVSVFQIDQQSPPVNYLGRTVRLRSVIRNIPSPHAITFCGDRQTRAVVTSPDHGSVAIISAAAGTVLHTIATGPQPFSAYCFENQGRGTAVVSNFGNSTLTVLDLDSGAIRSQVADVPGSRGLRGVRVTSSTAALVAGTEANVVTLVDIVAGTVVNRLPVPRPCGISGHVVLSPEVSGPVVLSPDENLMVVIDPGTLSIRSRINISRPRYLFGDLLGTFIVSGANAFVSWYPSLVEIPGTAGAEAITYWRLRFVPPGVIVTVPEANRILMIQQLPSYGPRFGATNAASFTGRHVAPGSLASTFFSTGVDQPIAASTLPLPTSLGGLSLRVGGSITFADGQPVYSSAGSAFAGLLFLERNQINFQVPPQTPAEGEAVAQLITPDGTTVLGRVELAPAAPGIFTLTSDGRGHGVVLNQDNTLNQGTNAAPRGTIVQIFATGAGVTIPMLPAGEAAPASGRPLIHTVVQPTVTIAGRPARVTFSGLAPGFVGVWQINAEVPRDADPSPIFVPLIVSAGGRESNSVTVAIR